MAGPLFIAGATGGVGQHVMRKALEQGWSDRLLIRDATASPQD